MITFFVIVFALLSLALGALCGITTKTHIDDCFDEYQGQNSPYRLYPNPQAWEFILIDVIAWSAGIVEAFTPLTLMAYFNQWNLAFGIFDFLISLFIGILIVIVSQGIFSIIDCIVRDLLKQRRLCLNSIRKHQKV